MLYTNLGKTTIEVSKICLGTMTFGEQNTVSEGHAQIDYALDCGINFIDTAEMYSVPGKAETQGSTETIVGTWISKNKAKRHNIILASKVTGPAQLFNYIAPNLGFSKDRINDAINKNLHRLQTDYIDIYQLHWPERNTNFFGKLGYTIHDEEWQDNFEEALHTLEELTKQGKIRHWGLSNETPWGVMRTCSLADNFKTPRPLSIQNPYNLLNRTFEIGLAEMIIREQIAMLAYSPLGFGLLSGKFHKGTDTPNDRINKYKRLSRYNGSLSKEATAQYIALAEHYGLSLTEMALAYVYSRNFVTSTIIGATNMVQLKENIDAINIQLTDEIVSKIEEIHMAIPNPAP
jgi:aryl-alcohol dehydrogenase-like predicted oxidoreductase